MGCIIEGFHCTLTWSIILASPFKWAIAGFTPLRLTTFAGFHDHYPGHVVCKNPLWYYRFYDLRYIEFEFDSKTALDGNDHGAIYNLSSFVCPDLSGHGCKRLSRKYDRLYLNGYEDPHQGEGATPIWINMTKYSHYCFVLSMYWSAQVVGTLGFGDINIHNLTDNIASIVILFLSCICRLVLQSRMIALLIYYDPDTHERSLRISQQRAALRRIKGVNKALINKVTQQQELQYSFQHLLESERKNFPKCMFQEMLYQSYLNCFELLDFPMHFGDGEMRYLASKFIVILIPRNEIVMKSDMFVRSIYIIKEGNCRVVSNSVKRRGAYHKSTVQIDQSHEFYGSPDSERLLLPGTCFGLSGHQEAELWKGTIVADQPCTIIQLDALSVQELMSSRHSSILNLIEHLFEKVKETRLRIQDYQQQDQQYHVSTPNAKSSLRAKLFTFRRTTWRKRTIFHPCETKVNIFFIITSFLKMLVAGAMFIVAARGMESDSKLFTGLFIGACSMITLIVMMEMVLKLHMGYLDTVTGAITVSGEKVTREYFSKCQNFPVDLLSLMPTWYLSIAFHQEISDWAVSHVDSFHQAVFAYFVYFAPLAPFLIHYTRARLYFQLPLRLQVSCFVLFC